VLYDDDLYTSKQAYLTLTAIPTNTSIGCTLLTETLVHFLQANGLTMIGSNSRHVFSMADTTTKSTLPLLDVVYRLEMLLTYISRILQQKGPMEWTSAKKAMLLLVKLTLDPSLVTVAHLATQIIGTVFDQLEDGAQTGLSGDVLRCYQGVHVLQPHVLDAFPLSSVAARQFKWRLAFAFLCHLLGHSTKLPPQTTEDALPVIDALLDSPLLKITHTTDYNWLYTAVLVLERVLDVPEPTKHEAVRTFSLN
jgi:hypothetical protein